MEETGMRMQLVSVGRSILDQFRRRDKVEELLRTSFQLNPPQNLFKDVSDSVATIRGRLESWYGPGGSVPPEVAERIIAAELKRWPENISAEIETFYRVTGRRAVNSDELLFLLATDTADGLHAALWNAVFFAGGDHARVRYAAEPHTVTAEPGVVIVRVPNLDARCNSEFCFAMSALGTLGRRLLPPDGEPARAFDFHLSGGLKAAIPYLIGLAEGLNSFPHSQVSRVRAHVLHDTTKEAVIPLPLRRLHLSTAKEELQQFSPEGDMPGHPPLPWLEGYAYTVSEKPVRSTLTPFGVGLRTLFGLTAESLVDG